MQEKTALLQIKKIIEDWETSAYEELLHDLDRIEIIPLLRKHFPRITKRKMALVLQAFDIIAHSKKYHMLPIKEVLKKTLPELREVANYHASKI